MEEVTLQEILNSLEDVVDAIKLTDNGTYFHQIKEELSGLNETMESINITLKEINANIQPKTPRPQATLGI